MPVFSLDDDIPEDGPREDGRQVTRYPGVGDTEEVLWAGWDTLADVSEASAEQARTRYVYAFIVLPRTPHPKSPRAAHGSARGAEEYPILSFSVGRGLIASFSVHVCVQVRSHARLSERIAAVGLLEPRVGF